MVQSFCSNTIQASRFPFSSSCCDSFFRSAPVICGIPSANLTAHFPQEPVPAHTACTGSAFSLSTSRSFLPGRAISTCSAAPDLTVTFTIRLFIQDSLPYIHLPVWLQSRTAPDTAVSDNIPLNVPAAPDGHPSQDEAARDRLWSR